MKSESFGFFFGGVLFSFCSIATVVILLAAPPAFEVLLVFFMLPNEVVVVVRVYLRSFSLDTFLDLLLLLLVVLILFALRVTSVLNEVF